MRGDVVEIRARGQVLLVGGAGALSGLPAALRQRSVGVSAVQRLGGETQAIHGLRHFCLRRSHPQSIALASDRDLLNIVAAAIAQGDVDAVVLPADRARPRPVDPPSGASTANSPSTARKVAASRSPADLPPPGSLRPLTITPRAAPSAPLAVDRMSLEERLAEVLRRAAGRLPRAMGEQLLSLVTPESIGIALGLAAFGVAAEFTPVGWAADVILAAIAFGFGGFAAIQALGDIVTCFERIFDARSERDLDEGAEALARATSAITVMGLAAILHEKASRRGRGGEAAEAPAEDLPAPRRSRAGDADDGTRGARQAEQTVGKGTEGERQGAGPTKNWTKKEVRGRDVYQRDDLIDPNRVDARGRTNLQRMQKGLAPLGPDGKPVNLHHLTQDEPGAMVELSETTHQEHSSVLHMYPNGQAKLGYQSAPPPVDRPAFRTWASGYWRERAGDFR